MAEYSAWTAQLSQLVQETSHAGGLPANHIYRSTTLDNSPYFSVESLGPVGRQSFA